MKRLLFRLVPLFPFCLLAGGGPAHGAIPSFTEDFSTLQYRDTVETTSFWDTLSGEIRLYDFQLTLAGFYDTPNYSHGIDVAGNLVFIADGSAGLQIVDVSDPALPVLVGEIDSPDYAYDVAVEGDYAYLADRNAGIQIIDISDPVHPFVAGGASAASYAQALDVQGSFAYLAIAPAGIQIVDISDPADPVHRGLYDTPSNATGVVVSGDLAYVTDEQAGLVILDVSDPDTLILVGGLDTPGTASGLALEGDYAFVADFGSGLMIIDVGDPANPVEAESFDTPGAAYDVFLDGGFAYVCDGGTGIMAIDVLDPANPVWIAGYNTTGNTVDGFAAGDQVYLADGTAGLRILDGADLTGTGLTGSFTTSGTAYGIARAGEHAYLGVGPAGVQVVDVTDPSNPVAADLLNTPGSATGIAIAGEHAYAADGTAGLQILDIANPESLTTTATLGIAGSANEVAVAGDLALVVADGSIGLYVADVSDPASPAAVGSLATAGSALDIALSGDRAFIADGPSGIVVVDFSDPTNPIELDALSLPDGANAVEVWGDYLLVASGSAGLQIVGIADPGSISIVGSHDTPGFARGIAAADNFVLIADYGSGLTVIDIADPSAPVAVDTIDTPGAAYEVHGAGDYALIADGSAGLQTIELFQRRFRLSENRGQSLTFHQGATEIAAARITASQTNTMNWELSADGGLGWDSVAADGPWTALDSRGIDLLWRTRHVYSTPTVNPSCDQLRIEWLYVTPDIDSIVDIPDDQGGSVRIHFTTSGLDISDQTEIPVATFNVWRLVENAGALGGDGHDEGVAEWKRIAGLPLHFADGRAYLDNRGRAKTLGLPPGIWEIVGSFAAAQMERYIYAAATLGDSTASGPAHTTYVISAHTTTPSIWFASEPDSGYSIDNIAPVPPANLALGAGALLTWDPNPEPDLDYYSIYASENAGGNPDPSERIGYTMDPTFVLPDSTQGQYIQVTATDRAGNEGGPSDLVWNATSVGAGAPPARFRLEPNRPNPFNPTTTVRFAVAEPGPVRLVVHDPAGRTVAILADRWFDAGEYDGRWDGRNGDGIEVAAGVYFVRMEAPSFRKTLKITLIR